MTRRPYRSDILGRLAWYVHHRPTTVVIAALLVVLVPFWAFFPEARP